ncbi:hypothetical protein C2G38_2162572 [Gigaspora rosea]|uniref:Uncharacterized protein n=1 Tax=Gigaspora rosea TaxID=44941 RepID=A0A397VVW9_9GLOM|nr:hypothetical protein C2G38_2162572 [Gigaspora rosea]
MELKTANINTYLPLCAIHFIHINLVKILIMESDIVIRIALNLMIPFDGHYNKDNTQPAWFLSCYPDIETRWTSEHKNIDDCIKTFQFRTWRYKDVIEWIPFDRLSEVKKSVKEDLALYIQQPG